MKNLLLAFVILGFAMDHIQAEEYEMTEVCPEQESFCPPPWYKPNVQSFYAGVLAGVSYFSNHSHGDIHYSFKPGDILGANFGYQFITYRLEGEFAYRRTSFNASVNSLGHRFDVNHLKNEIFSFMVNGYYDLCIDFPVRPYLGYGFGYARTHFKSNEYHIKVKSKGCAWQAMGGAVIDLAERMQLTVEYRYNQFSTLLHGHAVVFGFKYAL